LAKEVAMPRLKPADALLLNWDMLLLAAGGPPIEPGPLPKDGLMAGVLEAVKAVIAKSWPTLDSTEVFPISPLRLALGCSPS
jgi:hypothetical protein